MSKREKAMAAAGGEVSLGDGPGPAGVIPDRRHRRTDRRTKPQEAETVDKWTIAAIKQANAAAGWFFFSPGAMRFFRSRVFPYVYQGPGGVAFVTQETFVPSSGRAETTYSAREFVPGTGEVRNHDQTRTKYLEEARAAAKAIARGTN